MFLHMSVILSTGGWLPSMHHRWHDQGWVCIQGILHRGDLYPGGRGSASMGVLPTRWSPMVWWTDPPPELEKWAVCILLECFLVDYYTKLPWIVVFVNEQIQVLYSTNLFTSCTMINYGEFHEDVNRYINVRVKDFPKWRLIISKTLTLKSPI